MTPTRRCASADRKSTRLNSSHQAISYAVFCLKKKRNGTGGEERSLAVRPTSVWRCGRRWRGQLCIRHLRSSDSCCLVRSPSLCFFFLNDGAPPEIYPLPLPAPLPI